MEHKHANKKGKENVDDTLEKEEKEKGTIGSILVDKYFEQLGLLL